MASLTLVNARSLVREIAQDTSTSNPACTDSQVNDFIEAARQFYASVYPDEMIAQAGTTSNVTNIVTFSTTNTFRSLDWAYWTDTGVQMDKDDYFHILGRQHTEAAVGIPTTFGAIRNSGADNSWSVAVYPIADPPPGSTVVLYGHYELVLLTGDSDTLLFGQHGSRVICRIAALDVARAAGRSPQFLSAIAQMLPDAIQTRIKTLDMMQKPRPIVT